MSMTLEQAADAFQNATGTEALNALKEKLQQALNVKKTQLAGLQGELNALTQILRMVDALCRPKPEEGASTEKEEAPVVGETSLEAERKERLKQNLCTHRDRNKKWCERRLNTKLEKKEGYCKVHLVENGIAERTPSGKVVLKRS